MLPSRPSQGDSFNRLWLRCCAGDKEAFGEMAESIYVSLYHYGTKFTTDRDMVKDCIQDLLLDVWEKRSQLAHVTSPRSYLFQALRNNLVRRIRQQARFAEIDTEREEDFDIFSVETEWILRETEDKRNEKLHQILTKLPARQRHALYLRYYENLSYEEIGEVMGLGRQAVANYLQYGIQKLRQYWQYFVIAALFY